MFATKIVLLTAALVAIPVAAVTQADTATTLRSQYENCVYDAVGNQWIKAPKISSALAVETAFQMCATEEQAIYSLLDGVNVPFPQAQATVVGIKLKLKGKVREIMEDPAGYKQRHQ